LNTAFTRRRTHLVTADHVRVIAPLHSAAARPNYSHGRDARTLATPYMQDERDTARIRKMDRILSLAFAAGTLVLTLIFVCASNAHGSLFAAADALTHV